MWQGRSAAEERTACSAVWGPGGGATGLGPTWGEGKSGEVTLDLVSSVVVVSLHELNQLVQGGAIIGLDLERIWINS